MQKQNMPRLNGAPLKLELLPVGRDDQYLVRSEVEIVFILRTLLSKNTLVTLYFSQGNDFILTTLLDIDGKRGEMILDFGADEELNQRMLAAGKAIFIAAPDRIKIQFTCHDFRRTRFGGRDAFSVLIPESLLRIQRRKFYRIATPVYRPLTCILPLSAGTTVRNGEATLLNISCGGIALIDHLSAIGFEPGNAYRDCHITLPGVGTINADILVRTTSTISLRNGLTRPVAGCEFIAMPEKTLSVIQRYINMLECERRAKETGLG